MASPTLKRAPLTGTTTNTNAETEYLSTGQWNGNSGTITMQVVISRTSGTLAGTVTPEYSLDGTNFIAIPGTSAFNMTNAASNSQIWSITDRKALYYRLNVTTTGTVVAESFALFLEDTNPA
jgi:hypothetical protein